jgi:hypothetical protein
VSQAIEQALTLWLTRERRRTAAPVVRQAALKAKRTHAG